MKSTCDIQQDLDALTPKIKPMKDELDAIEKLDPKTTERRDRAVALKEKADRLKADADDLVVRATRFGDTCAAYAAQDIADEIAVVQKRAAALSA